MQLVQAHGDQQFTQATHHTAVRCRHALQRASQGLVQALHVLHSAGGEELVASELHCVLDDLASIIGDVHNDDILGEIFSRFCIGK
jgi:tRNA modification GTPase